MSRFCQNCGSAVLPEKKFCSVCGSRVDGNLQTQAEAPEAALQTGQADQAAYAPQPGQQGQKPGVQTGNLQQPVMQAGNPQQEQQALPQEAYGWQPEQQPAETQGKQEKGRKKRKAWPIVIGAFFLLILALVVPSYFALNRAENADHYSLGADQIPSIKLVVDKRTVNKAEAEEENGVSVKTIGYMNVENPTDDLTRYIRHLIDREGFGVTKGYDPNLSPGTTQLAKESRDRGYVIILDISYDEDSYTLVLTKGEGTYAAN